jgi:hypothetical protein
MKATIEVEQKADLNFLVRVREPGGESIHHVTLKRKDYDKLTDGKAEPEDLIKRSFEFLLEREPKESILARFDLSVIGRYFPEYESEMRRGLK